MLCKKCGAHITDTSKFCGYCGNPVNNDTNYSQFPDVGVNNTQKELDIIGREVDLGQTIKIEPVVHQIQNNSVVEGNIVEPMYNSFVMENNINSEINQSQVNSSIENQTQTNGQPINNNSNNKKNNRLIVIGGIVLAIVAVIVVLIAFMKASNSSVVVLEKALNSLVIGAEKSATMDAKVSFSTATGESFAFSATVKTQMKTEEKADIQITVNESLFFEEMNAYASVDTEKVTMYMESSLIDMMKMTYSEVPMWLYYTITMDELALEGTYDENAAALEIGLEDIIDEKHFVFVDKTNIMKHYELIIDQELVNTMKVKLADVQDRDIKNMLDSMETLEETIVVDFYINNSNELSKMELDMTECLTDADDISSFIVGVEFRDLNNTTVEIPSDAKNSINDLETYMTLYATEDYSYDDEYYYDYDNMVNTDLNNAVYGF